MSDNKDDDKKPSEEITGKILDFNKRLRESKNPEQPDFFKQMLEDMFPGLEFEPAEMEFGIGIKKIEIGEDGKLKVEQIDPEKAFRSPHHFGLRAVEVFRWEQGDDKKCYRVPFGKGYFHGWSMECEWSEGGAGNYTVAIVEREDGAVETVVAELIRFVDA